MGFSDVSVSSEGGGGFPASFSTGFYNLGLQSDLGHIVSEVVFAQLFSFPSSGASPGTEFSSSSRGGRTSSSSSSWDHHLPFGNYNSSVVPVSVPEVRLHTVLTPFAAGVVQHGVVRTPAGHHLDSPTQLLLRGPHAAPSPPLPASNATNSSSSYTALVCEGASFFDFASPCLSDCLVRVYLPLAFFVFCLLWTAGVGWRGRTGMISCYYGCGVLVQVLIFVVQMLLLAAAGAGPAGVLLLFSGTNGTSGESVLSVDGGIIADDGMSVFSAGMAPLANAGVPVEHSVTVTHPLMQAIPVLCFLGSVWSYSKSVLLWVLIVVWRVSWLSRDLTLIVREIIPKAGETFDWHNVENVKSVYWLETVCALVGLIASLQVLVKGVKVGGGS